MFILNTDYKTLARLEYKKSMFLSTFVLKLRELKIKRYLFFVTAEDLSCLEHTRFKVLYE